MHLICLGVTRTLVYIWKYAPPPLKLPPRILSSISSALTSFQSSIPKEFCKKPRSLDNVKRWKAIEFRQFLLYTGTIILKKEIKLSYPGYYDNFLSLHTAMQILPNPKHFKHLSYATNNNETTIHYYGSQFMTHNFHNILHADDVNPFGSLDSCSAFRFENYLNSLKRLVNSGNKPLQQIVRRLIEINTLKPDEKHVPFLKPKFSKPHSNGP